MGVLLYLCNLDFAAQEGRKRKVSCQERSFLIYSATLTCKVPPHYEATLIPIVRRPQSCSHEPEVSLTSAKEQTCSGPPDMSLPQNSSLSEQDRRTSSSLRQHQQDSYSVVFLNYLKTIRLDYKIQLAYPHTYSDATYSFMYMCVCIFTLCIYKCMCVYI